jgi:hypothetical protein
LPGDNIRERAEALALRGQAYWGLARNSDAKAAWTGALGRYEELGDTKAVADIHGRLHEIGADGVAAGGRTHHAPADHEAEVPEHA